MHKNTHILTVLLFLFLTSCTQSNDPNTVQSVPFHQTSRHIYQTTEYSPNGTAIETTSDTVTVASTTLINGTRTITYSDDHYITLRQNGTEWEVTGFDIYPGLCGYTSYPSKAGDSLFARELSEVFIVDTIVGPVWLYLTVNKNDVDVTVPSGSFTCDIYRLDFIARNPEILSTSLTYFSPAVGIVMREYYQRHPTTGKMYVSRRQVLVE